MARTLVQFDPLGGFDILRRQLFDEGLLTPRPGKGPTTDVYTDGDKALVVEAHLPNFSEKDVTVTVDRGTLVLQAERREKQEDQERKYVVRESSSSYYRSIPLPEEADQDAISADFSDGVLKVTVPLSGGDSPRTIQIESGGSKDESGSGKSKSESKKK